MPLTRDQVLFAGETPDFKVGKGTIKFWYERPSPYYLDEMRKHLQSLDEDDLTAQAAIKAQLGPIVNDWDYYEDKEMTKKVEITPDNIVRMLPLGTLKQAFQWIVKKEQEDPNDETPSAPTS